MQIVALLRIVAAQKAMPILRFGALYARFSIELVQNFHQIVDVLDGQPENLVFAKLLVVRIGGNQRPEIEKRLVHVLLPPALPRIGQIALYDLFPFLLRVTRRPGRRTV